MISFLTAPSVDCRDSEVIIIVLKVTEKGPSDASRQEWEMPVTHSPTFLPLVLEAITN